MADESAVKVCVRVRPLIQREQSGSESTGSIPVYWKADRQMIHQVDDGTITKSFAYDRVFGAEESTSQLYQEIAKPLVVSTVKGYNGTIFAYGQTSSGKTFTMMGNSHAPGVIPMAMEDVFQTIKNCPEKEFLLRVSYMEIYNETVTDLLCDSWKRKPLEIREGNYKNVYVADLTEELVTSADQALAWIRKGEKNRHYGKTKMNQRSSRSHTIFRMILESRERSDLASGESVDSAIIVSHLNLVDLAGAERASQTGAEGARLKEGCNINRSLFTLGQVIKKLSEENQGGFTNYRDSKLTRILQNSLGGNAKTVIVCTVTPAVVDETLSTLQFASAAKHMKNDPHVTEVSDDGALLRRYRNEIVDLKRRLEEVSSVTRTAETEKEVLAQLLQEKDQLQREQQDRIRNLTNIIVTSSNFVAVKKIPKRRVTWGGKHLRGMHFESHIFGEGEVSFAAKRKVDLSALADRDDEGDEFCSRWGILEEPTFDTDMNQSNITTRSFDDGDFLSPLRMSELSEKVFRLELQLKTEVQEKQDALETKGILEKRMAELEAESQRQREVLERRVAELEAKALKNMAGLEGDALEMKVVELEAKALEKREAEALEQKTALEKRVAELDAEALEQKTALEKRVAELEAEALEQKTALEKRVAELEAEALEQKTALEKRVAELEAEALQQKEELERRVAELQQQLEATAMHIPEDTQEQCKKDLEETIQLCEKLVIEKETVEAERDLIREKLSLMQKENSVLQEAVDALKQENCTLKWEKDHLLKEVEEKKELEEFSALEQESTKQYESELKREIAGLQSTADHSVTRVRQLEVDLAAMSAELIKKEECIAQLQDLNGKDLIQELEQLKRSFHDAEAVSRDTKKDWAVLHSENLILRERDAELSATFEKLQAEVQLLCDQQGADKIHFKMMQADLQQELQEAFEEITKLTTLLDSKVPKNLINSIELEKQVAELKKELELSHERVGSLQEEVQELTALRDFPAKVDQLMWQICELTEELCSTQADKDSLEAAKIASEQALQRMEEEVQEAQEQLAHTRARLSEAENRAAELNQPLEALQSNMGREQLLSSVKDFSHEVDENKQEQILEDKLAEQQQLVKDLKREPEQAAREEEILEEKSGQLVDEIKKLEEELETLQTERCKLKSSLQDNMKMVQQAEELEKLRAERDQLKVDLQENVEMMIENQEELRAALGKIKEQQKTMQKLENQIELMKSQLEERKERCFPNSRDLEKVHEESRLQQNLSEETDSLQLQVKKLGEELETLRAERAELQKSSQENVEKCAQTLAQLQSVHEELQRQQKVTSDLTVQNADRVSHLEKQVCSAQADKHSLEAAKSASEQQLQRLKKEMREAQEQLADAQARLSKAESRAAELNQQHLEACGQMEALQSDMESWAMERAQHLHSVKNLSHKVEQSNKRECVLEDKLAEQQQLVKDLKRELAEEQAARGEKENLEERSGQLVHEIKKLGEELETLRAERAELQKNLQESVEKCAQTQAQLHSVQEELERQQKVTSDLTVPNTESVSHLEKQVTQLSEELEEERKKGSQLTPELRDTSAQLRSVPSQKRSATEDSRHVLSQRLDETQQQLLGLFKRIEMFRTRVLQAHQSLNTQLEELTLVQNKLVFNVIRKMSMPSRKVFINLSKSTDNIKLLLTTTELLYADLAATHRKQFEAEAQRDLACVEEQRLQDLLLSRAQTQGVPRCVPAPDFQDVWDQRASELLEKREGYLQKLQDILAELEEGVSRSEAIAAKELSLEQKSNKELQVLCSIDAPNLDALHSLLEQELRRRITLVQQEKPPVQLLRDQFLHTNKCLQDFNIEAQHLLKEERGRSLALLQAVDSSSTQTESTQLVVQLKQGEQRLKDLQAQVRKLEESHRAMRKWECSQAKSSALLQNQLCEVKRDLALKEKEIQDLQQQLTVCSAQADKHSLEAAKSASEQQLQRLKKEMREAQEQLADAQARLSKAESRAAELNQQHLEACGQMEALQSDMESWAMERAQHLHSVKNLSHKVEQSNKRECVLEDKLAEQQQLVKDLKRELAEEQAARGEKENLEERSGQLVHEIKKLGEELETLRAERAELQKNLQESVEKCAQTQAQLHSVQEELERQQKVTSDLTVPNTESVSHLEKQVTQLSEELEEERKKGSQLTPELRDTSAQLRSVPSQKRSATEDSRHVLSQRLDETQQQLLGLFKRIEMFRTRVLQAHQSLNTQLEELTLVQNKLVFNVIRKMSMPSRKVFINLSKSTDNIKLLLTTTELLYADLAATHRKQFEAEAQRDLACVEEQRLQDLLLSRAQTQGVPRCVPAPDFQDVWDQRASELLEKREGYLQKLQDILAELEEGVSRSEAIAAKELSLEQKSNKELQVLCSIDAPNLDALHSLLEQELRRRITLVQQEKPPVQLLRDQFLHTNKCLQDFNIEAQHLLKEERGRSLALLQAVDSSSTQTESTQLVVQLKQGEQRLKDLQAQVRKLEESHRAMRKWECSQAKSSALLQNQLCEVKRDLALKEKEIQDLQQQLTAQAKKGTVPSALEFEELKNKLVRMEVERSAMTSSHQEEMAKMTVLLDHKQEALRKLKETLRKMQNQDDIFSSVGGATCPKASANVGRGRVVLSTAQIERAKLESDVKHLENEVDELRRLVCSQKEEITKWKGRALRLKENQRDASNNQQPTSPQHTPSKRQQPVEPCDTPKRKAETLVHPQQQDLASVEPAIEASGPESDLGMGSPPSAPQSAGSRVGTAENEKATVWWPMSPSQADICKPQ